MAKAKPHPVVKTVVHPEHCDRCDGSGWVKTSWINHGKYTEGVRRCPNWRVEANGN